MGVCSLCVWYVLETRQVNTKLCLESSTEIGWGSYESIILKLIVKKGVGSSGMGLCGSKV